MKKTIAMLLSVLMLAAFVTGFALAEEDTPAPLPLYASVTGTVTAVNEYTGTDEEPVDGWFFISLALENDAVAVLFVTDKTYYPFSNEVNVDDTVTGYYRTDMPMMLIYPPRYNTAVLVAGIPETDSFSVDRFAYVEDGPEDTLFSDDGQLAIRISEDTEVITPDGEPFDGELDGRSLAVIYDVSTRSIPAQTTPKTVCVLPEPELPEQTDETFDLSDIENMPIIVNGEELDAPPAFVEGDSIVMLPLRAVAEALGFTVTWDGDTRTITLGEDITLTIDDTNCTVGDMKILLAAAPVIVDDRTYVPISFFKNAAGMNNAYVFEGQIVIDRDGEVME